LRLDIAAKFVRQEELYITLRNQDELGSLLTPPDQPDGGIAGHAASGNDTGIILCPVSTSVNYNLYLLRAR